jgi:hypothetical protein
MKRRTNSIGVRLSDAELAALLRLREIRGFESMGHLVRALIREEVCRREKEESLAIVKHAAASIT